MAKRVLYVAWAPFFSGAERALVLTLQALDPVRYEPCVLAGTDGEFLAQARALGIPAHHVPVRRLERRWPIPGLGSMAAVARLARKFRPAIVHSNDAPSFHPAGYASRFMGIPSVTHVRFPDSSDGFRWFLRPGFSRALFVSQALLDDALRCAPDLFAGRADVLHDCVAPQAPWSDDERARWRRELGLPGDAVVIALTGQIAEVKGIWDFVDAAAILAPRFSDAFFAVLGDDLKGGGRLRREMEARVAAAGLQSRVAFLGFRSDAPRIVQAFDVIVVPSHVEPLGNATLEAMATGRPVVGSRVGGIPEMIVDGETGFLVPPRSPAALADALGRLVLDPDRRAAMSAAARRRAAEHFGSAHHGRQLQDGYDRLLAQHGAPALDGRRSPI